jgi:YbbR domain-containing protein
MEQDPSNAITIGPVGPSDLRWRLGGDDFHLPDGVSIVAFTPRELQLPVQPLIDIEVSVDAIIQGRPADGFDIGAATVTPSELVLRGPQSFLAEVSRMETTPVIIDGATGDVRQEVTLNNLRAFVEIVDPEPIVVAVTITNNTELVEVQAPIVFTSADAERCASATEVLSARFEGPVSTIGSLDRSLIMATIDCRSLVRAGEGRHQVRPEIIGHPTDLTVVWRSLDAVMVEVSPPPASPEPEVVPDSAGSGSIEQ